MRVLGVNRTKVVLEILPFESSPDLIQLREPDAGPIAQIGRCPSSLLTSRLSTVLPVIVLNSTDEPRPEVAIFQL